MTFNIQCYIDNFGLLLKIVMEISYQKYDHLVQKSKSLSGQIPIFMFLWSNYFCIISVFLRVSGVSHSNI